MKDVITSILTDTSMRDDASIEAALMQQAVASPWANLD
jgi:hypothetical protein